MDPLLKEERKIIVDAQHYRTENTTNPRPDKIAPIQENVYEHLATV